MELSWADLSLGQQAHVRDAFEQGAYSKGFLLNSAGLIAKLKVLQTAIKSLTKEEREFLRSDDELSTLYEGKRLPRTHLEEIEDIIDQHLSWVQPPGKGAPRKLARLYSVSALRRIWIEQGGEPAPGKRDHPNAFVRILGDCLQHVDPHLKDRELARKRAHYTLLELVRMDKARLREIAES